MFEFLKYNKRILFVGGLWNTTGFKKSIQQQLSRYTHLTFKTCRQVCQSDINKNEVIICYSIAIQYVNNLNLEGKKIILLSPLLNNELIKEQMIFIANAYIEQNTRKDCPSIINFIMNACGGDDESNKLWWKDMKLWNAIYANNEKIVNITPKDDWIIIEGRMPICKLPRIDIKTPYRHMIPISDDYHFLDKAI